jgi:hypothetical protein
MGPSGPSICGVRNPNHPAFLPCVRSIGHPHLHRDEYGWTWREEATTTGTVRLYARPRATAPPPPPHGSELELELARERAAHRETQGYLQRALRMALHYRARAEAGTVGGVPNPERGTG